MTPYSAILYELGRLGAKVSLVDAMPNRDGIAWLAEQRCLDRGTLNDKGQALLAELAACIENQS